MHFEDGSEKLKLEKDPEFLATDTEVSGSIPGATRFS